MHAFSGARIMVFREKPIPNMGTVSVLVQQFETELFFGKAGGWVRERAEARDFRRAVEAVTFCVAEHIKRVRLVINSGDPELDAFHYPFGDPGAREESQRLRKQAKALKRKQRALVQDLIIMEAQIARQALQLPLKRKKKREQPPPLD
jgi:hypothetical protein